MHGGARALYRKYRNLHLTKLTAVWIYVAFQSADARCLLPPLQRRCPRQPAVWAALTSLRACGPTCACRWRLGHTGFVTTAGRQEVRGVSQPSSGCWKWNDVDFFDHRKHKFQFCIRTLTLVSVLDLEYAEQHIFKMLFLKSSITECIYFTSTVQKETCLSRRMLEKNDKQKLTLVASISI